MILFLDSNVTIGYVFNGDKWNTNSKNVFKCPKDKYYSDNVLKETEFKIKVIIDKIISGLRILSMEILRSRRENFRLEDLHKIITKKRLNKIRPSIVNFFEENYNYEVGKDQLVTDIKTFINDFLSEYMVNFQSLRTELILHERLTQYPALYGELIDEVHEEDTLIVIDAHDVCKCVSKPLTFITADSEEERNSFIVDKTNIHQIIDLRDFYFKF